MLFSYSIVYIYFINEIYMCYSKHIGRNIPYYAKLFLKFFEMEKHRVFSGAFGNSGK